MERVTTMLLPLLAWGQTGYTSKQEGSVSHAGMRTGRMSAWQKHLPGVQPGRVVPVLSAHQYSVLYILIK